MLYAKSLADADHEFPEKKLDLYKLESKPVVLFQAANLCREEGNARLKDQKASAALAKYEEGLYIIDKCREATERSKAANAFRFRGFHVSLR